MIKKFFEYNSIKIGELELNIDSSLDKYKITNITGVFEKTPVDLNPKYSKKILKKYPFFKEAQDPENGVNYLEYNSLSGYIIIFESEDDYFYIIMVNYNYDYNYKLDQFYELLKVLKILLKYDN